MIVTIRSSSSELSSPALQHKHESGRRSLTSDTQREFARAMQHRLLRDTLSSRCAQERKHSPLVHVDIGLLADQVGITTSNTLDLGKGKHDLSFTRDIGVEQTQNVLLCEVTEQRAKRARS